jgi:photosystem II stability/assembly factor-like uncharacterized protein
MHALPPRVALVPNAIAFRDPSHGVMGTGWTSCESPGFGCRLQGTISLTTDGGKTWKVVLLTQRPVVWVNVAQGGGAEARLDDGETLSSTNGGRTWRDAVTGPLRFSTCPQGTVQQPSTALWNDWALCTTQGSAGSMGKSVWRLKAGGWKRVANTPFGPPGPSVGGIDGYGYPVGIAGARDGFGIIWESRGTLYVTRDGGSHWTGLPKVAEPEVDFGQSAYALPHGVGFVLLAHGGGEQRRLLETTDFAKTWTTVKDWR